MKRSLLVMISLVMMGACATGAPRTGSEQGLDETRWRGDARLYHILLPYPITDAQQDSLRVYAGEHAGATDYLLAEAAADTAAPVVVRVNALFVLAQRRAETHVHVFRNALDANDVRVRATAVSAMRQFVTTHPQQAISVARMALSDPEPEVQAQALQVLGDEDVDLLRRYLARGPSAELAAIAQDLVQLAEQRGAPLEGDSISGVLRRETTDGFTITFTPGNHWPQWGAGYGTVRIEQRGALVQSIERIEVVGGVIPVFLSPDARHAVLERDRSIIVRDMADGTERVVGPGVAPRVRPFTDDFVFMRERPGTATEEREKTRLTYDVFAAPFDPPSGFEPQALGTTTASVSFGRRGAYSPVRWMRVEERSGHFYLTSTDMEIVLLPDPFG